MRRILVDYARNCHYEKRRATRSVRPWTEQTVAAERVESLVRLITVGSQRFSCLHVKWYNAVAASLASRGEDSLAASQNQITQLLLAWSDGDKTALDQLIPMVHKELHRRAHNYMRRERRDHTLQTSALVNEAYLRLVDYNAMRWQDRAHFFAVAATAMRRILVDYARSRHYEKRGGDALKVSLDEAAAVAVEETVEIVSLDQALTNLSERDPRKSKIVEMRYFGGLSIDETAEVMGLSPATVKREWSTARLWLHKELTSR